MKRKFHAPIALITFIIVFREIFYLYIIRVLREDNCYVMLFPQYVFLNQYFLQFSYDSMHKISIMCISFKLTVCFAACESKYEVESIPF